MVDAVGTVAVVVSLVYVGVQVRQNTAAIQTSTSQDIYQLHQERTMPEMESPEFAALLLRVERSPDEVSAADSLRYRRYLNLNLNLQEAVYTSALNGPLEKEMAAGWLDGMAMVLCRPWIRQHWNDEKGGYHRRSRRRWTASRPIPNAEPVSPSLRLQARRALDPWPHG